MSLRRSNTTATAAAIATANTSRANTNVSVSDAELPEGTGTHDSQEMVESFADRLQTAHLLIERLRAWKHATANFENYCDTLAKIQKAQAKELSKVALTVANELREREHFDRKENGIAGLFKGLHDNTVNISNLHGETERQLRTVVLPILSNLHAELKSQSKEVTDSSTKTFKRVEKSRTETQKVLEDLAAQVVHYESSREKPTTSHDPLVINRHVQHKFNKQINEENVNLSELKALQERLHMFEAHIVETFQSAMARLNETMSVQADGVKNVYNSLNTFASSIPPEYEWAAFYERNSAALISQDTPPRSMENLTYPHQNHPAVTPLVSGHLQRKSRVMLKGWENGYWAISPAGFLHGFKDADPVTHEWEPDMALYLPDCVITKTDGAKFDIKGKNVAGTMSAASMSFEMHFKAITSSEAQKWVSVIENFIHNGRQPVGRSGDMTSAVSPMAPTALAQGTQGVTTGLVSQQPAVASAAPAPSAADREAQQARQDASSAAATPTASTSSPQ
ncbi:hypothetical protein KEM54_004293 [Ascosphaera aggregata]|nr:hypothetical protein KEM54_004293 [Ascosphaera aggregata]